MDPEGMYRKIQGRAREGKGWYEGVLWLYKYLQGKAAEGKRNI